MKLYHGTNSISAKAIVGPPQRVDVTRGGGELGRGFYLGENVAMASAWALGRYGKKYALIKAKIPDSKYVKLNTRIINLRRHVYLRWVYLRIANKTHSYLYNFDVICGPFATIQMSYQYKFESKRAENVLNHKSMLIIL